MNDMKKEYSIKLRTAMRIGYKEIRRKTQPIDHLSVHSIATSVDNIVQTCYEKGARDKAL
jgi:hypothetical protein